MCHFSFPSSREWCSVVLALTDQTISSQSQCFLQQTYHSYVFCRSRKFCSSCFPSSPTCPQARPVWQWWNFYRNCYKNSPVRNTWCNQAAYLNKRLIWDPLDLNLSSSCSQPTPVPSSDDLLLSEDKMFQLLSGLYTRPVYQWWSN